MRDERDFKGDSADSLMAQSVLHRHTHRWREVGRYGWRKIRVIYRCFCGETGYSAP